MRGVLSGGLHFDGVDEGHPVECASSSRHLVGRQVSLSCSVPLVRKLSPASPPSYRGCGLSILTLPTDDTE